MRLWVSWNLQLSRSFLFVFPCLAAVGAEQESVLNEWHNFKIVADLLPPWILQSNIILLRCPRTLLIWAKVKMVLEVSFDSYCSKNEHRTQFRLVRCEGGSAGFFLGYISLIWWRDGSINTIYCTLLGLSLVLWKERLRNTVSLQARALD